LSSGASGGSLVRTEKAQALRWDLRAVPRDWGAADRIMGPQTTAAIKDLQRQANLPQTGTMNAATQAALDNYLAHGNNQMAG
jgi:peptidoglycan hydrolase-like protein with peptidoglycan-binding domain